MAPCVPEEVESGSGSGRDRGETASDRVAVIGAGLAGSLSALSLARHGAVVELIAPPWGQASPPAATALSYGSVAGLEAATRWRELEALYGCLGWHTSAVVTHGLGTSSVQSAAGAGLGGPRNAVEPAGPDGLLERLDGLLERLPPLPLPIPFSRVDGQTLAHALPAVLRRRGVRRLNQRVVALERAGGVWAVHLADGQRLDRRRVLLAAGAASRSLWPELPERLRCSWAGVLAFPDCQGRSRWLRAVRRGWMVFPRRLRRPALEREGQTEAGRRWVVDVGLVPRAEGLLAGQISWLPPGDALDPVGIAAEAPWLEDRLREHLGRLDPQLASLQGSFRLVPVSYCRDGRALSGAVCEGLWVLAGCSNAFSHLPALADALAARIVQAEP